MEHESDELVKVDDDEVLTFETPADLQTYMHNRLFELGFDDVVRSALSDFFTRLDQQRSLLKVAKSFLKDCFMSVK